MYAEDLEELSELGGETWAGIVMAHVDETILGNFWEHRPTIRLGSIEVVTPDWQ
jgi:hypothetical protein